MLCCVGFFTMRSSALTLPSVQHGCILQLFRRLLQRANHSLSQPLIQGRARPLSQAVSLCSTQKLSLQKKDLVSKCFSCPSQTNLQASSPQKKSG